MEVGKKNKKKKRKYMNLNLLAVSAPPSGHISYLTVDGKQTTKIQLDMVWRVVCRESGVGLAFGT